MALMALVLFLGDVRVARDSAPHDLGSGGSIWRAGPVEGQEAEISQVISEITGGVIR